MLRHPNIVKSFSSCLRLDEYPARFVDKDVDVVIEHGLEVLDGVQFKFIIIFIL
jgi:hypothetical protein